VEFKYVRIQGRELAANTMMPKGTFRMCWQAAVKAIPDTVVETVQETWMPEAVLQETTQKSKGDQL